MKKETGTMKKIFESDSFEYLKENWKTIAVSAAVGYFGGNNPIVASYLTKLMGMLGY
jgi:hypothetical protein